MNEDETKTIKELLSFIALADHTGEVAYALPRLAKALGFPEPTWVDYPRGGGAYYFEWDEYPHYLFENGEN